MDNHTHSNYSLAPLVISPNVPLDEVHVSYEQYIILSVLIAVAIILSKIIPTVNTKKRATLQTSDESSAKPLRAPLESTV